MSASISKDKVYYTHIRGLLCLTGLQFDYTEGGVDVPDKVLQLIQEEGRILLDLSKDQEVGSVRDSKSHLEQLRDIASIIRWYHEEITETVSEQWKVVQELIARKEALLKAHKALHGSEGKEEKSRSGLPRVPSTD